LLLALVESGNKDIPAYKGPATGPFQVSPVAMREANRILYLQAPALGKTFFSLEDRHDYHLAKSMTFVVMDYWKPILEKRFKHKWGPYDAVAFHLYGPGQWRPTSVNTAESKRRNKRYDYYKAKKGPK